ncbi:MAG: DNA/RNA helicase domain-containing protein [Aerococcus suis]|nr:DNA/RNA helicase domain-containing protein [Aerococcus suis]
MGKNNKTFVEKIPFSKESLVQFRQNYTNDPSEKSRYLLDYPTVYIANDKYRGKYSVYVGETTDIYRRTIEHMEIDNATRDEWNLFTNSDNSSLYIIGNEFFNKSLTLDIENRLMMYLTSIDNVSTIYNRRTNEQGDYYTSEKLETIFSSIWRKLVNDNAELFPIERHIKDKALFKASPFHKLTNEQKRAKELIKEYVIDCLISYDGKNKLILVDGEAGSGKTVLLSSLFYDLFQNFSSQNTISKLSHLDNYLLVNHDEQFHVYLEIAKKLGIVTKRHPKRVSKPTTFINNRSTSELADITLIDEGHLLWTQGKQSYRGQNQLFDIIKRSKVTILVFDKNQILQGNQYWSNEQLANLYSNADRTINLTNQMRINSNKKTVEWIRNLVDYRSISNIPKDDIFELKIFDSPNTLKKAIFEKNKHQENGISRMIATYDWEFSSKSSHEYLWLVKEKDFSMPWNNQLKAKKGESKLSWPERSNTIYEVGSTYTVQGLDLNYAGLIIGPSVKYRNGKIQFDKTKSKNKNATNKRQLGDKKIDNSANFLKNELNVLLTRGVNGLYIYAVDNELQNMLLKAQKGEL